MPEAAIDESAFNSYPWTKEWTKDFPGHVNKATRSLARKLQVVRSISPDVTSMLDVGCGNGAFLKAADSLGLYSEGIDIDSDHIAFAREQGLRAYNIDVSQYQPSRVFDFIHIKESFHLVPQSKEFVQRLSELAGPRSVVYIDSVHADGLAARFRKKRVTPPRYGQLYPPVHNRAFNRQSMNYILERAGFNPIKWVSFNRGHPTYCPTARSSSLRALINPILDAFFLGGFIGCYAMKRG